MVLEVCTIVGIVAFWKTLYLPLPQGELFFGDSSHPPSFTLIMSVQNCNIWLFFVFQKAAYILKKFSNSEY